MSANQPTPDTVYVAHYAIPGCLPLHTVVFDTREDAEHHILELEQEAIDQNEGEEPNDGYEWTIEPRSLREMCLDNRIICTDRELAIESLNVVLVWGPENILLFAVL